MTHELVLVETNPEKEEISRDLQFSQVMKVHLSEI